MTYENDFTIYLKFTFILIILFGLIISLALFQVPYWMYEKVLEARHLY